MKLGKFADWEDRYLARSWTSRVITEVCIGVPWFGCLLRPWVCSAPPTRGRRLVQATSSHRHVGRRRSRSSTTDTWLSSQRLEIQRRRRCRLSLPRRRRQSSWRAGAGQRTPPRSPRRLAIRWLRRLVEWTLLRRADSEAGFNRYVAFIGANPDWPSLPLLRRRAEARLWHEPTRRRRGAPLRRQGTVERVWPACACARRDGRGRPRRRRVEVRAVWQSEPLSRPKRRRGCSPRSPTRWTRADHVTRMDRLIGAKDFGAAMRSRKTRRRQSGAIIKACTGRRARNPPRVGRCSMLSVATRGRIWATHYVVCHWDAAQRLAGLKFSRPTSRRPKGTLRLPPS